MGFFSDLKEDLSQAVNELMPAENPAVDETSPDDAVSIPDEALPGEGDLSLEGVSLEEMLKNIDDVQVPETTDEVTEPGVEAAETGMEEVEPEAVEAEIGQDQEAAMTETEETEPAMEETVDPETEEELPEEAETDDPQIIEENEGEEEKMDSFANREAVDETAVITAGMQITGDIVSEGSVDVIGIVNGNIDVLGKLNITGHINGNSKAAEIYAEGKINGEVISEGAVKIGANSVIIGNITATSAAIAGAVKGDIDVRGPVILDSSAIVMGNIKSKSVQINNGAVIEGMCSQCYADVSPTAFFDDYKPETKAAKKAK